MCNYYICRDTEEVADETKEESGKENLTDKEEAKPEKKNEEKTPILPDIKDKDKTVIFPRKVKSKFVATKPALWEQNVENMKNKNMKKK